MINVFYDAYRILFKVYSEGSFLKQAISEVSVDYKNRPKITKLVYGVLDKDVTLDYYVSFLCEKKPKRSVLIILKLAMYAIKFLGNAPHAVANGAVELVKKLGKGANAGFVNAVLRKYAETDIPLPEGKYERYSVLYSYPVFAVKRLAEDYGEERAAKIMNADEERTAVRFNKGVDGEKYLLDKRWNYEKTPFYNCFFVKGFKRDEDYDKGIYTFQSVGSVAVCDLVGQGNLLLDACAAPGGKSVFLSDNFSYVVSRDIHAHRVKLIEEYAERMEKNNISAEIKDSSVSYAEDKENFDVVLCDAPCSGYGVIKDNPDIKLFRTDENVRELNGLQLQILRASADAVKVGGFLCYSTCSVFNAENDGIIGKFLEADGRFEAVRCESPLKNEKGKFGIRFFPDVSFGAGFYFCKMKRISV